MKIVRYPAIAISDVSHISCVSNDFGYDYIFSRYVEAVGREGDVLLGSRRRVTLVT